jgi:hypothetical protein
VPATQHFTFDLTGALADQLHALLPALTPEPLTFDSIANIGDTPGVYQLYRGGALIYVGKADMSLRNRLTDHFRKLSGRENISVSEMSFTGLFLEGTWIPVGPEQMLIKRLREEPTWNTNGFGINDPGKERDTTRFRADHFDVQFPANLNVTVPSIEPGVYTVRDVILKVKRSLPYVFRFQDRYAHLSDYQSAVTIPQDRPATADHLFTAIVDALPVGWQIVALPGYVVMYKNHPTQYQSARKVYLRSTTPA